ncbi:UNVERIFIED_CONTAM: hypothetical protein Sangu_1023100 [Sesamum angustifolium]|uniref:Uncharacterized protein n=1 Tax=Sesamum angustifolium TaxID=2727405 RepID=A0AAW2NXJ3_9LAMI
MASSSILFLQEPSLNWRNHIYQSPQFLAHTSFTHFKIRRSFEKVSVKCFFTNDAGSSSSRHGWSASQDVNKFGSVRIENRKNPVEIISKSILNALKALRKPVAAAVLVGLLLMYDPCSALAASGGRMGGNSFSSRSSMSRDYSVPSFFLILTAFAAFILVSGFLSDGSESSVLTATERTSVLKLQVGLLGLGRSLQKDLNRIAETADTSTSEGLHYVLTETVLALLRHPDYCISAYSSVDVKKSVEEGRKDLINSLLKNAVSLMKRHLLTSNSIKKQSLTVPRASGFSNEYIVITILVAAGGAHKLPSINNSKDLKEALQKLASIPSSRILAVEVLWTPQNEDDTLSERELLEDYSLLRPL